LALLGKDDGENLKIAHRKCHREHTATDDIPRIARAKRQKMASLGIKRAGQKIPRRPKTEGPARDKLPLPPRRALFEDVTR